MVFLFFFYLFFIIHKEFNNQNTRYIVSIYAPLLSTEMALKRI